MLHLLVPCRATGAVNLIIHHKDAHEPVVLLYELLAMEDQRNRSHL
jgi:hypothetical protein